MTKNINEEIIAKLREIYEQDPDAVRVFDWLATLTNDAKETSISRISSAAGISNGSAVRAMKSLESISCGKFVAGRKGHQSRFVWRYSRVSLGQAASGETSDLQESMEETSDDGTMNEDAPAAFIAARAQMAEALGIDVTKLQVTIIG